MGEAFFKVNANANWSGSSSIIGEDYVDVFGEIAGSGWTRINPDIIICYYVPLTHI